MQKNNTKASILIWSIFLSLIISISFLSISTKITKNLKNSSNLNSTLEKQNTIKNILNYSENDINNNVTNVELGNTTIYIENKTLKRSLKKDENLKISFSTSSNIKINLTNSGIIYYSFNSDNGILNNSNLSVILNGSGEFFLENFAGYSSFELSSDNKFDIIGKKYKIIEKIGNKEVIKSFGVIK